MVPFSQLPAVKEKDHFWYSKLSIFKKDLKLQIHLHKTFFSDDQFLGSLHKSFLNQTTLDLRKEKWNFLNRELTVLPNKYLTLLFCQLLIK